MLHLLAHAVLPMARQSNRTTTGTLPLSDIERTINLFLSALSEGQLSVREIPRSRGSCPYTDGRYVYLPARLECESGPEGCFRLYKVMAAQKFAQVNYGVLHEWPDFAQFGRDKALAAELFRIIEDSRVERLLLTDFPGLTADFTIVRRETLISRPVPRKLPERLVEGLLRALMMDEGMRWLDEGAAPLPPLPIDAARIARCSFIAGSGGVPGATLKAVREILGLWQGVPGRFRRLAPVIYRGQVDPAAIRAAQGLGDSLAHIPRPDSTPAEKPEQHLRKSPRRWPARYSSPRLEPVENELAGEGLALTPFENLETWSEFFNLDRPLDPSGEDSDLSRVLDDLETLSVARLKAPPAAVQPIPKDLVLPAPSVNAAASIGQYAYPEWDCRRRAYRDRWAVVWESEASHNGSAALTTAFHPLSRPELLSALRREFAGILLQRQRTGRQAQGDDPDLDALVRVLADLRAGTAPDERLYIDSPRRSPGLALAILLDVSASGDSWVSGKRILDIHREALFLMAEALGTSGHRFAIYGFNSKTRLECRVCRVKNFEEPYGATVRGRIAGLEPMDYTRLGAPLRHVTNLLGRENSEKRVLLVLTDGRPNDFDGYEGRYGIADVRMAVQEARRREVYPVCLSLDPGARGTLREMFGPGNYLALDDVSKMTGSLARIIGQAAR